MTYVNGFTRLDRCFLDSGAVCRVDLYGSGCVDTDLYGIYCRIGVEMKRRTCEFFYACRGITRGNKKVFRDDFTVGIEADRYRGTMILRSRSGRADN